MDLYLRGVLNQIVFVLLFGNFSFPEKVNSETLLLPNLGISDILNLRNSTAKKTRIISYGPDLSSARKYVYLSGNSEEERFKFLSDSYMHIEICTCACK